MELPLKALLMPPIEGEEPSGALSEVEGVGEAK